jgi:hypothetical protein
MTYQWYRGGTLLSGATTASYSIGGVTSAAAGSYTVKISNTAGTVTSDIAVLTVQNGDSGTGTGTGTQPVTITTQPASRTVTAGSNVTFSVVATGTAPLTYQWYRNETLLSGATASTYSIASVTDADAGRYTVRVTNVSRTVTSTAAVLTVQSNGNGNGNGNAETGDSPIIEMRPALASKGVKLVALVAPKGSKAVYEWSFTSPDGRTTPIFSGAKNTYTAKAYGNGIYSVKLTYTPKGASAPVVKRESYSVKLIAVPKIAKVGGFGISAFGATNTGVANGVVQGESLEFTVKLEAGDTGPLVYTWLKNGKEVLEPSVSDAHESSCIVRNIGSVDGKAPKISVRVETVAIDAKGKPLGKVTSKAITPKLILPPTVGIKAGKSVLPTVELTVVAGKSLTIATKATGTAKLQYAWYRNNVLLATETKANLSIKNATVRDAGSYRVVVKNAAGTEYAKEAVAVVRVVAVAPAVGAAVAVGSAAALPGSAGRRPPEDGAGITHGSGLEVRAPRLSGSEVRAPSGVPLTSLLDFAPEALAAGTLVVFDGSSDVLEILSATEISGGTYAYERLSATTARLSYVVFADDAAGTPVIETGEVFLVFDALVGGTYTHISEDGEVTTGVFALESGGETF